MFDEYIGNQFRGDKKLNKELEDYIANYGTYSKEEAVRKGDYFIRNIDNIGVNQLLNAMRTPYSP